MLAGQATRCVPAVPECQSGKPNPGWRIEVLVRNGSHSQQRQQIGASLTEGWVEIGCWYFYNQAVFNRSCGGLCDFDVNVAIILFSRPPHPTKNRKSLFLFGSAFGAPRQKIVT